METEILGWWFAKRDPDGEVRLPNHDGRVVMVGDAHGPRMVSGAGARLSLHDGVVRERALDPLTAG